MKKLNLLGILVLGFTSLCSAQMSTFPAPPPLPPPSDQSTNIDGPLSPPVPTTIPSSSDGSSGAPAESPASGSTKTSPITASTLSSMTALDDKIALEAGDSISFRVIEDRDQAVPRVVTDTGEVDFPYVGRVKVEGKTCRQVAIQLKRLLEVDYYKQATVIVGLDLIIGQDKAKPHDLAWVVGQVRQVGPQELSKVQPLTVSQLILKAGGFGEFADQRKVRLIRRGGLSTTANASPPLARGDSQDSQMVDVKSVFDGKSVIDPIVKPNDYIIVPKRFVNF